MSVEISGKIKILGSNKSFFVKLDGSPDEVIPFLQKTLKDVKSVNEADIRLFDQINDNGWLSAGADNINEDFSYYVDISKGTIKCVISSFDANALKSMIATNQDVEKELEWAKDTYGDLGEIKIENNENGKDIVLYAKLR